MGDWYEELPNEVLDLPSEADFWAEAWPDVVRIGPAGARLLESGLTFSHGNLFSGKGRPETPSPSPMRPFAGFEVVDFGLPPSPVPTDYYAELT